MWTLLALLSAPALADVSPPFWYREDCLVEKLEQDGTTCESCGGSYMSGQDTAFPSCEELYSDTEFSYVCQTYGASSWTEVWCDGPPREGVGCAIGGVTGGLWGLALFGIGLARRREG